MGDQRIERGDPVELVALASAQPHPVFRRDLQEVEVGAPGLVAQGLHQLGAQTDAARAGA
jgi:hypothetical protein